MTAEAEFVRYSVTKLREQCTQVEERVALLAPEQVWERGGESQNAVGNLLLHLTGNIRQWILNGLGGQSIGRDRDAEFAARGGVAPEVLLRDLRQAVEAACLVIEDLPPGRLTEQVHILRQDVSVLEAIYHVVQHFSGHAGQILFLTKALTGKP